MQCRVVVIDLSPSGEPVGGWETMLPVEQEVRKCLNSMIPMMKEVLIRAAATVLTIPTVAQVSVTFARVSDQVSNVPYWPERKPIVPGDLILTQPLISTPNSGRG